MLANAILLAGHLVSLLKMLTLSVYFNQLLLDVPEHMSVAQRSRVQSTSSARRYSVIQSQRLRFQSN